MTAFGETHTDAEVEELCQLMLGLDRRRLLQALQRLEDRGAFTELQSRTLAGAMRLALARDPEFAAAMGALISKGVHATVERDSAAFGRALAPAMGPAIRNSVRLMLQNFVQSIETVVDQQLSWRSVKWRLESWRTGRRYAEVVFRHTLLFQVEHVFLVHRADGIQLLHVSSPNVIARDPDLISAMLTAIQDFGRDAFDVPSGDTLSSFAVGDLRVGVESGSHTLIAAVVRGQPPHDLRLRLRDTLDRVESLMGPELAAFDGDVDAFEAVRQDLESCLAKSELPGRPAGKRRRSWMPWALFGAAVLGLVWLSLGWVDDAVAARRFGELRAELEREPGIVVTGVESTAHGWIVRGLRDPLSRAPDELARQHGVAHRVEFALMPHHSLAAEFVQSRLDRALAPPPGVTFGLVDGHLTLRGSAPHAWCSTAAAVARALPGVEAVDLGVLEDLDEVGWREAAAELAATPQSLAGLARHGSAEARWLADLIARLRQSGAALARAATLRCGARVPAGDDVAAAARQLDDVVRALAGAGLRIECEDAVIDPTVGERVVRFAADYSSR